MPKFARSQPRQRNTVEVVSFRGTDRGKPRGSARAGVVPKESEGVNEPLDLHSMKNDISIFIDGNLQGREKSQFVKGKLEHLGAAPAKAQKMPFKMAVGVKRAREERERKEELLAKQAGLKVPSKKKKAAPVKGRGRWKESSVSLDGPVRKSRGSAKVVSGAEIAKVMGRKKKR